MSMNQQSARFLLRTAGRNLEQARRHQEAMMAEVKLEVIRAHSFKIPITEIAKLSGLTRQTIYTILQNSSKAS